MVFVFELHKDKFCFEVSCRQMAIVISITLAVSNKAPISNLTSPRGKKVFVLIDKEPG